MSITAPCIKTDIPTVSYTDLTKTALLLHSGRLQYVCSYKSMLPNYRITKLTNRFFAKVLVPRGQPVEQFLCIALVTLLSNYLLAICRLVSIDPH